MKITPRSIVAAVLGWCSGMAALPHAVAERDAEPAASLIVVAGAGGEKEYGDAFTEWATTWRAAGAKGGANVTVIGTDEHAEQSLDQFRAALRAERADGSAPLWLVLLGHGTADAQSAKFNLHGDDLTAAELAEWLAPMSRPVVFVAGFSASGAFLPTLSAPGRLVVTATKSGGESNYARFGGYLARAIVDPAADVDHDSQTSLLEGWLHAARQTADFYSSDGRLATEHSLLDDNGDARGTPADWFQGIRVVKKSAGGVAVDGQRAHQVHLAPSAAERALSPVLRAERDAIEAEIAKLRTAKAGMAEEEYFAQLEAALLRLARIYRDAKNKVAN